MNLNNDSILQAAETLRSEMVGFLRDLIAIQSLSGSEGEIIQRIEKEMLKLGYDDVSVDPMGNLLGRLGDGEKIIAIDGHCDTVDAGDLANWNVDPYQGDYKDSVIFGRGASDQKGGLASAVYAGSIIKKLGIPRNTTVYVVASIMEERFEGLSWRYIIEQGGIKPDLVLLTEPTDLKIAIGQRGRLEMKVKVRGVSCHGSAPERGENAIYLITPIVRSIEKLDKKLSGDTMLGDGTIAVTDIRSTGPSLCAVPDASVIHLDRRLTSGETHTAALLEVKGLQPVRKAGAEVIVPQYDVESYKGYKDQIEAYYPAWVMDRSDPWLRRASDVFHELFRKAPEMTVWRLSTNGVATRGMHNIPTIGFGPGKEAHAHTPNDQVNEHDLLSAASFYAYFVLAD